MPQNSYSQPSSFVPPWVVWGSLGVAVGLFAMSGIIAFTDITPLVTAVGTAFVLVGTSVLLLPSSVGAVRWVLTYGGSGVKQTITSGNIGRTRVFVYPFIAIALLVGVTSVLGPTPLSVPVLIAFLSTVPLLIAGVARFQAWRETLEPEEEPLDRL